MSIGEFFMLAGFIYAAPHTDKHSGLIIAGFFICLGVALNIWGIK